jgi:cobalt-zinc-cadmium efflux system membrane fusion protein
MTWKTLLMLIIVAIGGIALGAVGMHYVGSWEGLTQTLATLRQPASSSPATRRAASDRPTDQAGHDAHEGHAHQEETHEHGAAPHVHTEDEHSHAATTEARSPADRDGHSREQPPPVTAKGSRPSKADTHGHKEDAHQHGAEPPHQTNAKSARAAKTDTHGHGADTHGHDHDAEQVVRLSAEKAQQLGIEVAVARPGSLQTSLTLPGTVALNADRLVHIVSRVPGIVQEIRKNLGDAVQAGEVMAVVDSRELADTKAAYLAARERSSLAETTLAREKDLWAKQISPEQDYLTAKQATAEARIELRVAAQKLQALGFSEASVQQLAGRMNAPLTRYEVVAPIAGTVIEKHIAVGELLKDDTEAFVVADLSTVWVDLHVPPKHLSMVRKGQRATIAVDSTMQADGTVSYVGPLVSEDSRTVVTRVVLPNPDGRWRPGLFVTATLVVGDTAVPVQIPKTALQTIDGKPSVFVQTSEGFRPRPVTLGRANETHVEITAGLQAGERYAAAETFILKADLGKGAAAHDH